MAEAIETAEGITREEFEEFVALQESGVTNMCRVNYVSDLLGMTVEKVKAIMKNYAALKES